jgi:hypothetical protein
VARFFPEANQLMWFMADVFTQRVTSGKAIWDIADVYWKIIDEEKILGVAKEYLSHKLNPLDIQAKIEDFTQDERMILSQYIWVYNMMKSDATQYQSFVSWLLKQSLWWSSQVIIFEMQ